LILLEFRPLIAGAKALLLFVELRGYSRPQLASLTGYPFFKNAVNALPLL
jgi:hypothetical protein